VSSFLTAHEMWLGREVVRASQHLQHLLLNIVEQQMLSDKSQMCVTRIMTCCGSFCPQLPR